MSNSNNKILFIADKKGYFNCNNNEKKLIKDISRDEILNLSLIIYKEAISPSPDSQKNFDDYVKKSSDGDINDPYSAIIYNTVYECLENIFSAAKQIRDEINSRILDIKK